jgi:hypothetical protein
MVYSALYGESSVLDLFYYQPHLYFTLDLIVLLRLTLIHFLVPNFSITSLLLMGQKREMVFWPKLSLLVWIESSHIQKNFYICSIQTRKEINTPKEPSHATVPLMFHFPHTGVESLAGEGGSPERSDCPARRGNPPTGAADPTPQRRRQGRRQRRGRLGQRGAGARPGEHPAHAPGGPGEGAGPFAHGISPPDGYDRCHRG